jgi:DNA-binding beta-propeller fold protein YncE
VLDAEGMLYVTDPAGDVLLVFDTAGRLVRRIAKDDAGISLSRPTGVALDRKSRILYVVNSGNSRVSIIQLGGKATS